MKVNGVDFTVGLQEVLDELVSQLRLNNIQYIQKIKDSGEDIQVCCPYHKNGLERKPSAGIRKSDGMFHCFACNEIHTLPEVISFCFGHEDDILGKFGWSWLLKNFAIIEAEERKDVALDFHRSNKHADGDDSMVYVTEEELDRYRYIHPYMYKRKLTDEVIELFDIGYDKDTECITFPVRDIHGNCLFVARRSVKTKFFNYPQGVEKPLYGLYELHKQQESYQQIIVCESMLDALTCWVYGECAVALNGLGNGKQFRQLSTLPTRHLILATDNDEAGMKARKRIKQNVRGKLITEYILPDGKKDINELTEDEFKKLQEIF